MSEPDQSKDRSAGQAAQTASAPAAKRNWFARHWIVSLLALLVGSCAFFTRDRTVSWEEEVLLNTGETIWVKRYVTYKFDVTQDNPFVPRYGRWGNEGLSFEYRGEKYSHNKENDSPILIAIHPARGTPSLIYMKEVSGWTYPCAKPFYDQWLLAESPQSAQLLVAVEAWSFGLRRNLLLSIPDDGKIPESISWEEKMRRDKHHWNFEKSSMQVDPVYQPEFCKR